MAKLIYSAIASLDGYIADEDGNFDWAAPDEELHAFVNSEHRLLGDVHRHRHHQAVHKGQAATDEIFVPARDGIEGAGVDRGASHGWVKKGQNAECRLQNSNCRSDCALGVTSAICILHSAFCNR